MTAKDSVTNENGISNAQFCRSLYKLRELHSFLNHEAIELPDGFSLGQLNQIQFDSNGRKPTTEEWDAVEKKSKLLFSLLSEPLRRRFLGTQIPNWFAKIAIVLVLLAAGALMWSVIAQDIGFLGLSGIGSSTLPLYIVWLMSLGALGSLAFIGFGVISVSDEVTFDLSNTKIIQIRIVLGSLFALILTLPFGFYEYLSFVRGIYRGGPLSDLEEKADALGVVKQSILLLLPFVIGYSTSLTITIMNRLMDAIRAFFGIVEKKAGENN
ncbi:hypothetical protein [Hoeflea alexandrii]|uniref:hypothetical protein n=1 Tax=Hoeflea alexandrii TaxID=288436 RepID=UPI0022AF1AFE|nr:hypothetical protein [Hoeflea alexandrii]MCZ4288233.1 hypothetical protein [Hoeflea alexandrii]